MTQLYERCKVTSMDTPTTAHLTTVNATDGPIYVSPCGDRVGMSVNIDKAYVHTFMTPGETSQLIAALTDALHVVTP